jgi:hydrogenase/urease accessory protein HupE
MKKLAVALVTATTLALSGPVSAHLGEHGTLGFLSGLDHLLTNHGFLLALLGIVAGALILKRVTRS